MQDFGLWGFRLTTAVAVKLAFVIVIENLALSAKVLAEALSTTSTSITDGLLKLAVQALELLDVSLFQSVATLA